MRTIEELKELIMLILGQNENGNSRT